METLKTSQVFKLPIHLHSHYQNWLIQRFHQKKGTHVVTLNAEMAMLAEKDTKVAEVIREADLVIPDGAGIVLYLRLKGQKQQRTPGIELAQSLLMELGKQGTSCPICFYGGKPGVAEEAAKIWQKKIPNISIFTNHGYLNPEEQIQWANTIQGKQPKLILVGLGVPRQEYWIRENFHLNPQALWIGVGGSFDIWAGVKNRAPSWLRDNYLEWLYRLYQEPWRWRRMLVLPQFLLRAILIK